MEHFWLAVAIGTFLAALWAWNEHGFEDARQWFWFPAISLAMFFFRRFTRKKLEAMEERRKAS